MLLRAGASNRPMVAALGVDISRLFMLVFAGGAMLAGFAGAIVAPILSVDPGMGESILILTFVVIVIGGVGIHPGRLPGCDPGRGRRYRGPHLRARSGCAW